MVYSPSLKKPFPVAEDKRIANLSGRKRRTARPMEDNPPILLFSYDASGEKGKQIGKADEFPGV
jgi:hypothetical protein